jgi:glycogen operon protein
VLGNVVCLFFNPHPGFCKNTNEGTHHHEYRDMVKALYKAGIGVILAEVFAAGTE